MEGNGLNRKEKRKRKKRGRRGSSPQKGRMNLENEWQTGLEIKETIGRCRTTTMDRERELVFKGALASSFFLPRFPFSAPWSFLPFPLPPLSRRETNARTWQRDETVATKPEMALAHWSLFIQTRVFFYSLDFSSGIIGVFRSQLSISNGSNLINYKGSIR